jgi:hypothetical protein
MTSRNALTTGPSPSDQRIARIIARLPPRMAGAVHWLRRPGARPARLAAGVALVCGGVLSILPVLGLWMLPLGLVLLSEDVPTLRRLLDRALDRIERTHPHWLYGQSEPPR